MFVLKAARDDLISPNVLEGKGCAGSAGAVEGGCWGGGAGSAQAKRVGRDLGTYCCALLLEMKNTGGKSMT